MLNTSFLKTLKSNFIKYIKKKKKKINPTKDPTKTENKKLVMRNYELDSQFKVKSKYFLTLF